MIEKIDVIDGMNATKPVALDVTLSQLYALRSHAKALHLNAILKKNRQATDGRVGIAAGRGLAFREVRSYQAGDDLRHLDWKVTARRGEPYTRMFHEEQQRPVMLFVDLASQLQFGQAGSKAVLAAKIAAVLGWTALQDKDRVGGWIETDQQSIWQPLVQQARGFSSFLSCLAAITQSLGELKPRPAGHLDKALEAFARRLPKDSLVIIISDWVGWTNSALLKYLNQHYALLLVHLIDPLDQNLPSNAGAVVVQGKVQRVTPALQHAWQAAFLQRVTALKAAVGQKASYLPLSTAADCVAARGFFL